MTLTSIFLAEESVTVPLPSPSRNVKQRYRILSNINPAPLLDINGKTGKSEKEVCSDRTLRCKISATRGTRIKRTDRQ